MNKDNAIKILIQVAYIAQKAGALSLQDAAAVANAIAILSVVENNKEEKEEVKNDDKKDGDTSETSE